MYCAAQQKRISGALSVATHAYGLTPRYNEMVDDYNARCSHFEYENDQWPDAQSKANSRADLYAAEGVRELTQ